MSVDFVAINSLISLNIPEIILFVAAVNILILSLLYGRTGIPILLIEGWWFFWLFVSSFSLSGMFIPSYETYKLFLLMVSSISLGAISYKYLSSLNQFKHKNNNITFKTINIPALDKRVYNILLYVVLPIVVIIFIIGMKAMAGYSSIADYRLATFDTDQTEDLALFANKQIALLYGLIIKPLFLVGLFMGTISHVDSNNNKLLYISSLILVLDAISTMGRFAIYYILFCFMFAFVIKYTRKQVTIADILLNKLNIIAVLFVAVVAFISILRVEEGSAAMELFNLFLIEYHTMSFTIFDLELNNPSSILHDTTYGLSTFGKLQHLVALLLSRIGINMDVQSNVVGIYLNDFVVLGYSESGRTLIGNAFGSVLFNLYRDGGVFFIVVASSIYGYFLSKMTVCSSTNSYYHTTMLLVLTFIGFFGIFQPVLSGGILLTMAELFMVFKYLNSPPEPLRSTRR